MGKDWFYSSLFLLVDTSLNRVAQLMIGESLIKELFIGCQQGQGKPLRNDKAPQGQKLLEVVKILRPRGVMGGKAPGIRENSGCGRGRPDKSQGLG